MSESMVQSAQTVEEPAHQGAAHPHEGAHPTEKQYMVVALVLAVLTAIEVGLYYVRNLPAAAITGMLGVLALAKFVGVVGWFMHLRFDSKLFRRFFVACLLLALVVYVVTLATFHVFTGGLPQQ